MEYIVCSIPMKGRTAIVTSNQNIYDIEQGLEGIEGRRIPIEELQKIGLIEIEADPFSYEITRSVLDSPVALSKKEVLWKIKDGHYKLLVTPFALEELAKAAREKLSIPYVSADKKQPIELYSETSRVSKKVFSTVSPSQFKKLQQNMPIF